MEDFSALEAEDLVVVRHAFHSNCSQPALRGARGDRKDGDRLAFKLAAPRRAETKARARCYSTWACVATSWRWIPTMTCAESTFAGA